jgi:multicomponent Na+:H+ antiporter subunit E
MTRFLVAVVALCAVYALVLVSLDPVDLATGALIASLVLLGLRRFLSPGQHGSGGPLALLRQLAGLPAFVAVVALDTIRGTWDVALVVLGARRQDRAGIVVIPFDGRTPSGAIVSGLAATVSPGELLIDVDETRGLILMHVLDARDPDAIRDRYRWRYERWQRRVAP